MEKETSYNRLITILGPTASGKTQLATRLAYEIDGEVISADSRQIYAGMDIGTGKDLSEYIVEGWRVPHHLIDIKEAGYKYNLHEYKRDFSIAFSSIKQRGKTPILCGGTGLYIEAVLKGYNMVDVPENIGLRDRLKGKSLEELRAILAEYKTLHNTTDTETIKRALRAIEIAEYYKDNGLQRQEACQEIDTIIFGIDIEREKRRDKISYRLRQRIDEGMIEEVKRLLDSGLSPDDLIYYGLEYKFLTQYLIGEISKEEMIERLEIAIHQFAKRQMTWFRGMEKRGFVIHWLPYDNGVENNVAEIKILISNK